MVEGLVKYSSRSEGGNELQGIQGLFKPGQGHKGFGRKAFDVIL